MFQLFGSYSKFIYERSLNYYISHFTKSTIRTVRGVLSIHTPTPSFSLRSMDKMQK
jgi:hypothetical protein